MLQIGCGSIVETQSLTVLGDYFSLERHHRYHSYRVRNLLEIAPWDILSIITRKYDTIPLNENHASYFFYSEVSSTLLEQTKSFNNLSISLFNVLKSHFVLEFPYFSIAMIFTR